MTQRKALRELIGGRQYVIVPGAYDALSARLVEQAGFRVVYLTGGGYSRSSGFPDVGLLTMTENLYMIARCVDSVGIPVIADADNGYGNALNVVRAIREYERAGVAGLHIEDQVVPKRCGHYEGKAVIACAEMVGKIRAAVDARRDGDLVIIARTDARAVEGLDAAIGRVNAYLEAGADVGFVEAPESVEEMAEIPKRLSAPALINVFQSGKTPALPAKDLDRMGYRLGIYPSQTQRAAIRAVEETLRVLNADGDTTRIEERLATFQDRERIVGTERWREMERVYLETAG